MLLAAEAASCGMQLSTEGKRLRFPLDIYRLLPRHCLFLTVREASYCLLGCRQCREVIPPCNYQAENEKVPGLGWESHSPHRGRSLDALSSRRWTRALGLQSYVYPGKGLFDSSALKITTTLKLATLASSSESLCGPGDRAFHRSLVDPGQRNLRPSTKKEQKAISKYFQVF